MNDNLNDNIDGSGANRRQALPVGRTSYKIILVTIIVAALVLALDLSLPLGVASAVPYVVLVLMGIWFPKPRHVYLLAALGTALTIIGYLGSPSGGVYWIVLTNRGIALFAIWITALLISSRKKFENELLLARKNLEFEVTERTRELQDSKQKTQSIFENAQVGISRSRLRDGKIFEANKKMASIFGYDDVDEFISDFKYSEHYAVPEDREKLLASYTNSSNQINEIKFFRRDGSIITTSVHGRVNRDENYADLVIIDISESKKAQENIQKLSLAVEQSPSMVFITDVAGNIEYINKMFTKLSGYTVDEVIGETPRILKSGDAPADLYTNLWRTIKSGREWRGELKDRHKDGSTFWAYASISPVKNETGDITHFISMHEDITKRKEIEIREHKAKEEAEMASRAKSELLANMSHELRTPLNAIIGFSETMKHETFGPVGSDKNLEYLDDIHYSGQHLLELINDILDVSAIEAGALELYEESINLTDVVNTSVRLIRSRADNGQVSVTSTIDPEIPMIYADARRIKQVFLNLLSNAVKFTPADGEVTVSAQLNDDGSLAVAVADSGIGMDKEEVTKALSAFGLVDSGLDRRHEGSGLGLPLTKGLMELHSGTMEIESEKGHGSLIMVTFPKERVI